MQLNTHFPLTLLAFLMTLVLSRGYLKISISKFFRVDSKFEATLDFISYLSAKKFWLRIPEFFMK